MKDNMPMEQLELLWELLKTDLTELYSKLNALKSEIDSLPEGEEKGYVQKIHKATQTTLHEYLCIKTKFMSRLAIEANPISFILTDEAMDVIDEKLNSRNN
jgi:hypothetical protein